MAPISTNGPGRTHDLSCIVHLGEQNGRQLLAVRAQSEKDFPSPPAFPQNIPRQGRTGTPHGRRQPGLLRGSTRLPWHWVPVHTARKTHRLSPYCVPGWGTEQIHEFRIKEPGAHEGDRTVTWTVRDGTQTPEMSSRLHELSTGRRGRWCQGNLI